MSIICPLGAFLKVKDYEETETLPEEVPALDEEAKTENIPWKVIPILFYNTFPTEPNN